MFENIGHRRDPEWLLRQVLTVITLVLGLSCGCGGVALWMGVRLFFYLLGLLLGLILPPPPPTIEFVQEVELVELELEDPTDIVEEELEAPDYGQWLAAQEAAEVEAEILSALAPERALLSSLEVPQERGLLAVLTSGVRSDMAMYGLWGEAELVELKPLGAGGGRGGYLRTPSSLGPVLDSISEPPLPQEALHLGVRSCEARVQVNPRGRAGGDPTWRSCPEPLRRAAARAIRRARWSWPSEPLPQEVTVTVWFSDPH